MVQWKHFKYPRVEESQALSYLGRVSLLKAAQKRANAELRATNDNEDMKSSGDEEAHLELESGKTFLWDRLAGPGTGQRSLPADCFIMIEWVMLL